MQYSKFCLLALVGSLLALAHPSALRAQVRATAEISAHQEFVLGDYASRDYTAKLHNRGKVAVEVRAFSKASDKLTRKLTLKPGQRRTLHVVKDETIIFVNDSDEYVEAGARLSYGVEGMSSRPIYPNEP